MYKLFDTHTDFRFIEVLLIIIYIYIIFEINLYIYLYYNDLYIEGPQCLVRPGPRNLRTGPAITLACDFFMQDKLSTVKVTVIPWSLLNDSYREYTMSVAKIIYFLQTSGLHKF